MKLKMLQVLGVIVGIVCTSPIYAHTKYTKCQCLQAEGCWKYPNIGNKPNVPGWTTTTDVNNVNGGGWNCW